MPATRTKSRLFFLGILLFLLGLLTGLANPAFKNPRMGLSAHLEGVMNGMFLIVVGLIWDQVILSARFKTFVFRLLVWGTYVNWFAVILSGIFGTSRMTPLAGAGFNGAGWQEALVGALFVSVAISMVLAVIMLAVGVLRSSKGSLT